MLSFLSSSTLASEASIAADSPVAGSAAGSDSMLFIDMYELDRSGASKADDTLLSSFSSYLDHKRHMLSVMPPRRRLVASHDT